MDKLFQLIGDVTHVKLGGADSYTDQLNCRYTVYVLSLFAVIATARVYVDEPISCYCPAEFESSQVAYAKKVCWTSNTFYLPYEKELTIENRKGGARISYYQWVTLIFSLQAFLFHLPRPIWRMLNRKSGIAVNAITDAAIECQRHRDDSYDKTMKYMVHRMGQFLTGLKRKRQVAGGCCGRFSVIVRGSYLSLVYLLIKVMYLGNVVGQLFLLNAFLGTDYHLYGWDVLRRMFNNEEWITSTRFPRVTLCDFQVRKLGNIHNYTVQCALPMNLFYEMMFIFLWFWMVFVLVVTVFSFLQWVCFSYYIRSQVSYVKDRLVEVGKVLDDDKRSADTFVRDYLRRDGCFIIRLVSKNAGDRIAGDLVAGLWDQYEEKEPSPINIGSQNHLNKSSGRLYGSHEMSQLA